MLAGGGWLNAVDTADSATPPAQPRVRPGDGQARLLVRLRPAGVAAAAVAEQTASLAAFGQVAPMFMPENRPADMVGLQRAGLSDLYVVTLPSGIHTDVAIAQLAQDPQVLWVEEDALATGAVIPSDPEFVNQWSLDNQGQNGGIPDADIDATEAWDLTNGMADILIAVVDGGVDLDHPDLRSKLLTGRDYVNKDDVPQDDYGHGTHVAGILGAVGDNGIGVTGVCPRCTLLAVKVLDANNVGYYSWIAEGIIEATDRGAHIINLSLGGAIPSTTLHGAVKYADEQGVLLVAAMMNQGDNTPYYPAVYTETIAVGATTRMDRRAFYSNAGNHIDLVAPGSSILSTLPNNRYDSWTGTSMAVPHVAGTIALMLSANPGLEPAEIREILRETADEVSGVEFSQEYGYGRLNAGESVRLAHPERPSATPTPTFTQEPTLTPTETPTEVPTATPTETPTATPTATPTVTPTATPTLTSTVTPTNTPTNTVMPTLTPTPTGTPTATETPRATATVTPTPLTLATPDGVGRTTPTPSPTPSPTPDHGGGPIAPTPSNRLFLPWIAVPL